MEDTSNVSRLKYGLKCVGEMTSTKERERLIEEDILDR